MFSRVNKYFGWNLIKVLSLLGFLLITIWMSVIVYNTQENLLKERELRDISTHTYIENYDPKFTNVTANYRNDLSKFLLNFNLAKTDSKIIAESVNINLKQLASFFNLPKSRFTTSLPSQNFTEYAWKKIIQSGQEKSKKNTALSSPDLRVLKARNPLVIKENSLGQFTLSSFAHNKIKTVDILYFLIDSHKLQSESATNSIFTNLWFESEYMDSFNLSTTLSNYDLLLPEINPSEQKSLVIISSNKAIIQNLLAKAQDSKFGQWLKASAFDAYMPTENFEILIEIIPLEISPNENQVESKEISSNTETEDDFFESMSLKHWLNPEKREDYELSFLDKSIKYTNKAGFDFMSFSKQYCQEDIHYLRFEACEFLKRFSEQNKLAYSTDMSAKWANDQYQNYLNEKIKVFEYNGEDPITMQRNNVYGLNLNSNNKRNFVSFMSNKRIFDIQTDLNLFISGLMVDGPISQKNTENILNNTALLGYNLDSRNLSSEVLFKADGPFAKFTNFSSWTDWTLLGNQNTKSGTMVIVAWDDLTSQWIKDKSMVTALPTNKFSYELEITNEDQIYFTDESINLSIQLKEKAGIGVRTKVNLEFVWTGPDTRKVPLKYSFINGNKLVNFKNLNFNTEGVYNLSVKNQFGESLLKYKFVVRNKRKLKYRVYLIPFYLSDNYKASAPEDPTPSYHNADNQSNYPSESTDTNNSYPIDTNTDNNIPDESQKECSNQGSINTSFNNLRTATWEDYYKYENNYQRLLDKYIIEFRYENCEIPVKKERPTRIIYTGGGGSGGGGGGGGPVVPPGAAIINHVFPIQCYIGRRTYNTEILQLENNTANDQTITFRLEPDNLGNPATEDNFTAGNADFWIFASSVDSTGGAIVELPNPRDFGFLAQWNNAVIQVEIIAGVLQIANANMGPFVLPAGEKRQIATVLDCGVDMLLGETGKIRVTIETND